MGVFIHKKLSKPQKLPIFTISVGNITTGGTGKTEFVLKISNMLSHRKVCILSRGYKCKYENKMAVVSKDMEVEEIGDEPWMMARRTNFPIIVGKNRVKTAKFAIDKLGVDIVILDDGFQYLNISYDLNILLINGNNPYGNGHLLPLGILREPLSGISRADVIVITKKSPDKEIIERIRKFNKKAPIFEAYYKPKSLIDDNEKTYPLSILSKKNVLALSGIGDPRSFEDTLKGLNCSVFPVRYPDHHLFSNKEIEKIKEKAKNFDFIVSTLKDRPRIKNRLSCLYLIASFSIDNEEDFINFLKVKASNH